MADGRNTHTKCAEYFVNVVDVEDHYFKDGNGRFTGVIENGSEEGWDSNADDMMTDGWYTMQCSCTSQELQGLDQVITDTEHICTMNLAPIHDCTWLVTTIHDFMTMLLMNRKRECCW